MRKVWNSIFLGLLLLSFPACGSREGGATNPGGDKSPPDWVLPPETILLAGASLAAIIGVVAFFAALFLLWLGKRKLAITAFGIAITCIIGAPIVYWLGENLWWIALLAGILLAGVGCLLAWKNIEKIEAFLKIDINRDGHIGPKIPHPAVSGEYEPSELHG